MSLFLSQASIITAKIVSLLLTVSKSVKHGLYMWFLATAQTRNIVSGCSQPTDLDRALGGSLNHGHITMALGQVVEQAMLISMVPGSNMAHGHRSTWLVVAAQSTDI